MRIDNDIAFLNQTVRKDHKLRAKSRSEGLSNRQKKALDAAVIRDEEEERQFWLRNHAALLQLGNSMPMRSGRRTFANAGCIAALSAIIAEDVHPRGGILSVAWGKYRYSHRHAGFLLGRLTGDDPKRHLWFKDEGGLYHLHADRAFAGLKLAA